MGNTLKILELGKQKLLRKCEYRGIPESIMWLHIKNDRIYAADSRESFHVLKYNREMNKL